MKKNKLIIVKFPNIPNTRPGSEPKIYYPFRTEAKMYYPNWNRGESITRPGTDPKLCYPTRNRPETLLPDLEPTRTEKPLPAHPYLLAYQSFNYMIVQISLDME